MTNDQITIFIRCIDDMTDDLLEIADVLEEHQINVKMENGRYLNPVSAIRSKVDVIWDEVQAIAAMLGEIEEPDTIRNELTDNGLIDTCAELGSERDEIYNAGFDNGIKATLHQLDGLLVKTDSAVEIQAWVDEQWKEYES